MWWLCQYTENVTTRKIWRCRCEFGSRTKASLQEKFGDVDVNLEVEPRQITLDIEDTDIPDLRKKLIKLGYPMSDEDLSKIAEFSTTAKSFVSCAVGKMNS